MHHQHLAGHDSAHASSGRHGRLGMCKCNNVWNAMDESVRTAQMHAECGISQQLLMPSTASGLCLFTCSVLQQLRKVNVAIITSMASPLVLAHNVGRLRHADLSRAFPNSPGPFHQVPFKGEP